MIKRTMPISIIDDSRQEKCDAGCGEDWSSLEVIALAKQRIKDRFGDKMQLQYFDLSRAMPNHEAPVWDEVIKNKNLSLPLLVIDGQLIISGLFDTRQLLDAIEAKMEIEI